MREQEFDKFAEEYRSIHATNIAITGEQPEYFAEYKIGDIAKEYRRNGRAKSAQAILDFGAGVGTSIPFLTKYFASARLTCLDVSSMSLAIGQKRFAGVADFVHFNGSKIPLPNALFDIAFAACVFHHIDHSEHVSLLAELRRVLKPGGMMFVFEHNPYNPLTVHAINHCPFDENAKLIRGSTMLRRFREAGFGDAHIRYRIFFPHALRALRGLESQMYWCPLGAQYYVVATKPL
jgi:SAM-dependent methyltransferase